MTEFTTTTTGDQVAYDRRGAGPALIFVAGAGPFRAIDPHEPRPSRSKTSVVMPCWAARSRAAHGRW
jgi:hypothetical protein